jgi:amino acid adenylation domain-containing protein/non-ribosomal peptide synthase protein (TIGR01720 family)
VLLLTPQHEQDNRLLLVVHHLAVDGVSWRILLEDLETALADSRHRESSRQAGGVLSPKGSSVRQWYEALDTYSHSPRLLAQAGHWADVTERYQPLGLSGDGQGSRQQCSLRLDAELTRALLQEVPAVYHTEINDVLLTALTRTLCEDSGRKGIVIGLEGHGRESSVVAAAAAIEGTVGWFTSLYPVWLPWQEGGTGGLVAVKEALRQVPDKGIGYGVLRYMVGEERTQRQPRLQGQQDPWEVTFNYLGQTGRLAGSQGLLGLDTEQTGSPDTEAVDGAEENNRRGIEVNSLIMDGQLVMNWRGMAEDPKLLKQLAERYKTALSHLINRCLEQKAQDREHHTPSDYGLGGEVSFEELEAFLSAPEREGRRADRIEGLYRLSALQEGLLFHSLYAGEQGAYWQQLRYELRGLEEGPFLQSWERIIARHTILRSGFYYDVFPIPVQVVYRELRLPVEVTNLERQDKDLLPALLEGYAQQELSRGMNLEEGPLLRLKLLRLAPGHYRVIWTFHHLVLDGWSLPVLLEELLAYYTTLTKGETPVISPVDRYEDYIRFTEGQDKAAQEAYWRRYLSGLEGGSLLPFIPSTADRNKEVVAFRATEWVLDKEKSSRVSAYVQRHHLTNNTLIQGIWAYLLYRYTDKSRVVFGVTVSGRPEELAEVEDRVGLYINMLPLSTEVSEERRMVEWLTQLQQEQLESRRYQYVSLNKIQGWAGLGGELFDSMISFQNFPVSEALRKGSGSGLQVGQMELQEQLTNYPLGLRVTGGERLKLEFIYKDQLLPAREVERIRGHFERVLDQVIDGSDKRIGELQLLTEAEQKQLDGFNATAAEYPRDKTVVQLFEAQVTRTPAAIAVVYEGLEMSYAELDARSNQLGHYLRGRGVKEEVLVGVCLERSIELIIGILGILKAGGAYVPMDPAYPVERIGYMVEDTGMRLVVSSQLNRVLFEGNAGIEEVVVLDSTDAPWRSAAAGKLNSCLRPDQAAYVIYTSGSTGRPKGAIIEHRNVVRLFRTDLPLYDFGAEDVWTLFHSSAFDFSVWEMYGALLFGGRLVIVPVETTRDADRFAGLLTREGVTVLNLTPSAFYAFEEKLTELTEGLKVRFLIFGGEALSPVKLRTWKQRYAGCRIVNMYGITETTVHVTYKEIGWEEIENGASNIGRPIPTLSCYVLAANGQPAPVGVPGELYVGGAGVARGYLNRPELTAQRFIPDPFGQAGGKLYRSGDLARWLPDGNLVYLGRIDHQVKIRGYRIELGEIETVLQKAPGVAQAVVVVRDELQGQKQLIGYFVPGEDRDKTDILSFLGARLPDHMLPSMLIELNEMPLTPNGKVDKKKLPAPAEASLSLKNRYAAPESEIERELCAIWQELLRIERIGIYDNFFELGGNSLLAIRLISYIKKKLTLTISIHSIFQFACISDLGKYIEVESNAGKQEAPAGSYDILNI